MNKWFYFLSSIVILSFLTPNHITAGQQSYSGNSVLSCNESDTSSLLYACNDGNSRSCKAFLIFRTQPPYDSADSVSKLTGTDPSEVARINRVPGSTPLPPGKELIVPVTCSCSGQYYQANTSYVISSIYDTYFTIANDTYQGLASCGSLLRENVYGALHLVPGLKLRVPLRCACPTGNQMRDGVRFILTYLITWGDKIPKISTRFNVSDRSVAYANGLSDVNTVLFPFTTLLIPLPNEPLSSQTRVQVLSRKKRLESERAIFIGIGVGTSSAILCLLMFMIFCRRKRSRILERTSSRIRVLQKHVVLRIARANDQGLKIYKFDEVEQATEKFSLRNRVGASVFRGVLRGKLVAVKRMSRDASREAKILQKINHFNLISLYGACEHGGVCYLVYEFMENGSLRQWLEEDGPEKQNWNHRIRIALDIARGLQYLHNFTNPVYVHKDINSSNILLNRDLRAKISNFSLARSQVRDEDGISSVKHSFESKGYLAPENLESGLVTSKMDVYAFGVVLLELITGRKAAYQQDGKDVMLSEVVVLSMENEPNQKAVVDNLVDPRLQAKHPLGFTIDQNELALRLVKLSIACLKAEPEKRLSMVEVVSTLMIIQEDAQSSETW